MPKKRDLSPEQRRLIDAYIELRSYSEAYRRVYPDCDHDGLSTPIKNRANAAFSPAMRAEIARLDAIAEEAERKEIERAAREAAKKWSKADAVNALVGVVRKCERQLDEETARGEGVNTRVADTMRGTIDTLNKMLGYNEPEKQAVDSTISVVFGGDHAAGDDEDGVTIEDLAE